MLDDGPPEGTVVYTPEQRAGRGQRKNAWHSAPGLNLTFSVLYHPQFLAPDHSFALNRVASLAVRAVVAQVLPGHKVEVKWPNDVLVNDKKIAGILIETTLERSQLRTAIIGIGLNVNQTDFPDNLVRPATSLALERNQETEIRPLMEQIWRELEGRYLALRSGRTEKLDREYLEFLYGYQEWLPMEVKGESKMGMVMGVDPQGRLALQFRPQLQYFDLQEIKFVP